MVAMLMREPAPTMTQRVIDELDLANPKLATYIAEKLTLEAIAAERVEEFTPAFVIGVAIREKLREAIAPAFTADKARVHRETKRGTLYLRFSKPASAFIEKLGLKPDTEVLIGERDGGLFILPIPEDENKPERI